MSRSVDVIDPANRRLVGRRTASAGGWADPTRRVGDSAQQCMAADQVRLGLGSTPIMVCRRPSGAVRWHSRHSLAVRGRLRVPQRADLPAMFAIGVGQLGLYFALAHEAVVWVPAGRTAILANTTTIWVVPLSLIFLHERIPLRRWLAAGLRYHRCRGPDEPVGDRLDIARRADRAWLPAGSGVVMVGGDHRHPCRHGLACQCSSCCLGVLPSPRSCWCRLSVGMRQMAESARSRVRGRRLPISA